MTLSIHSKSFRHNEMTPARYTCDGPDISPPLAWTGIPDEAKSLALIVDDPGAPDPAAPKMTRLHWVQYNIPVEVLVLEENVAAAALPSEKKEGTDDWGRKGYGGPCLPKGKHRNFFQFYALDTVLSDLQKATKVEVNRHLGASLQKLNWWEHPSVPVNRCHIIYKNRG